MTFDLPFTRTSLQDQILGNLVTKRSFVSQIYDKKSCKVISALPRANSQFSRGNFRCELLTPYTCFAARSLPQSRFRVAENPKSFASSFASTKEGQLLIPRWEKSAKVKQNQLENNFGEKELRSKKEKKIYLTPDELQNKVNDLRKKQIIRISKRIYKIARRLKVTQLLTRNHRRPEWMILSHLPVLPPDLRPILQMSEKVIVASDLNIMYQRVIYRNNRHLRVRFIDFHLVTAIQRLVQDAVDRLIENGKGGSKPYYTQSGRPLKSLSDILKGKKGRFRLNLLGKRVDFSGRSVIVVSPSCKIHECGLPKDIALELYHYFLLRQLIVKKYCASIVTAKKMIKSKSSLMWDILRELMYHHPVLLNRAPTLHRLGIQAFQPKLVLGNAILLHPLVCSGFNADFDGDQMGVHLPLSFAARAESWDLLWSRNNLLSPATGQPMLVPSQDMVLGFYYITAQSLQNLSSNSNPNISRKDLRAPACLKPKKEVRARQIKTKLDKKSKNLYKKNKRFLFLSTQEITTTFQKGDIKLHTPVWLHWNGKIENEDISQIPLELRIDSFGKQQFVYEKNIYSNYFTKDRNENEDLLSNFSIGLPTIHKKQSFQEATKQLPYNQLYNSSFPTKIYQPFSFICTKSQVYYVRTTAGRILMNNLLDIKKNI